MKNRESGFTLINALMGLGLLGATMAAFMSMMGNTARIQNRTAASIGFTDKNLTASQLMSQTDACKATLEGKTFAVDPSGNPMPGAKIGGTDGSLSLELPGSGGTFLQVGDSVGNGSSVSEISVHSMQRIDETMFLGKMRIASTGTSNKVKDTDVLFRALVGTTTATIFGCMRDVAPVQVHELYHPDLSTWTCKNDIDLEEQCGDADGCRIRLTMIHENHYDQVRIIDENLYIEQDSMSDDDFPGLYAWVRQSGGGNFSAHLGHPSGYRYTLYNPWGWTYMFNYIHAYCPGQSGSHGPAYTNPYMFSIMAHPAVRLRMFVYD